MGKLLSLAAASRVHPFVIYKARREPRGGSKGGAPDARPT